jgi:hypothetical protein
MPDGSLFSWITEAGPGTETTYEKRKCLLYRKDASPEKPGAFANAESLRARQAWIDLETRQPIAYDNGLARFLFTFGPAPASPLTMPADFAKLHARILGTMSKAPSWAGKK